MTDVVLAVVSAYLTGSVPTGYLAGRVLKGIDIREHGSGNLGATNVFRVLGKGPGIAVLLLDIAKGVAAVAGLSAAFSLTEFWELGLLAVASVCGHNWTVFLKFRGGKGVATTLGALIGLAAVEPVVRPVILATFGVWLAVFILSGIVSLSSILAAISLPILMLLFRLPLIMIILGCVFSIFVIARHKANMTRLKLGQEKRLIRPFLRK